MSRVRVPDGAPIWLVGQAVKTPASHAGNGGSIPPRVTIFRYILHNVRSYTYNIVGVDDAEGTPVPIPNTEVKLCSADDTWLATARENRKMPTYIFLHSSVGRALGC